MNKALRKVVFALAIAATAGVGFAQQDVAPVCEKHGPPMMEMKARAPFDEETFKLIHAYRQDASEANLDALKAKLATNYNDRITKLQAKVDEMKANRDQHIEAMLKKMTDPEAKPMMGECRGPRPMMKGHKGPRPMMGEGKGRKGPRYMMGERKGPRPEGRPEMPPPEGRPDGDEPSEKPCDCTAECEA